MTITQKALQLAKSRRAMITGVVALVFFVLFSVTGFFILPPYVKKIALEKLSTQLGRPVSIRSVSLNPYALSATVNGLEIKEPDLKQTFFSADRLYVNLRIMPLLKGGLGLKEIRVEKPYLHIVRTAANTYNFSDIMERSKKTAGVETPSKPFLFSLDNIGVVDGSVDFMDGPLKKLHTVRSLTISIPFVSDFPSDVDKFEKPMVKAIVNGTSFTLGGDSKPFSNSVETSLNIDLKDIDIPFYMDYFPVKSKVKIRSGRLDIAMAIAFRRYKDHSPTLKVSGDLLLKKFIAADLGNNPVMSFDALAISIASAEPFKKQFSFSNIVLQSPSLAVSRDRRGALSLLKLMPDHPAPARKSDAHETAKGAPAIIDAGNIECRNGVISFHDASTVKPFATDIRRIDAKISHFSTLKDRPAALSAAFVTESGENMKVEGEFGTDPVFYEGNFSISSILLKKYMPYLARQLHLDITDGKLDLTAKVSYKAGGNKPVMRLTALDTSLRGLRTVIRGEKEDFLRVPVFSIKDTSIDLTEKKVDIGSMFTDKDSIVVRRNKDGFMNISDLMAPSPKPILKTRPWTVRVRFMDAKNLAARIEDLGPGKPVMIDIDRISFRGRGLSTEKNARGAVFLSCRVAKTGSVAASGNVSLTPPGLVLAVNVKNLPLIPLQPYVDEKARVLLTGGAINATGKITGAMAPKTGPTGTYKGKVWINNFATADAMSSEDLLKWDTLYMGEMDVRYAPLYVGIDDISLTNLYSRIIISADRKINLREVLNTAQPQPQFAAQEQAAPQSTEHQAQAAVATQKPSGQKMVRIDKITLQGGTIDFTDHSIKPDFRSKLSGIGGSISGLSSEESKFGDVDLRGTYDGYAPLEITGKINPLRNDLYVDLKFNFKDMDLTPLSPYSGRYAGYTIQEGKLSFRLEYLIVKNKLDSKNDIHLGQFTFGEPVESPQATKLPVRLAIALLKDRNGNIDLDIPVSGDIHNPQFSVGSIVWKVIKNILVKAATSPFALLSAIFGGGGEQMSYIEFDNGVATFSQLDQKKLDNVVKALYERPSLKLDIEGYADTEKDPEGLKKYFLTRKVKAQKLKELAEEGNAVPSLDSITVTEKEYPEYLKRAYRAEKFPKPRNFIGMVKSLPVPEMEKLMLANSKVTAEDLRTLASERAMAVKNYILKSKQIEPERVFFVQPKSLEPEKKDSVKNSRVDLKLK